MSSRLLIVLPGDYRHGGTRPSSWRGPPGRATLAPVAFRLEQPEGPAAGIRRVVAEQVDASIDALGRSTLDTRDECIHDVRKRAKRIRATIRLARDDLGGEAYRRENACFRDVARALAPARDASVLVKTLDAVVKHYDPQLRDDAFAVIRKVLVERCEAIGHRDVDVDATESVQGALTAARARVPDWPLTTRGWADLAGGVERTYARARDGFAAALDSSEDIVFHEWRKQVKYVWHQIQLLAPAWPEVLDVYADEVHRLADDLGHAHDLALLGAALEAERGIGDDPVATDALTALVERRRLHEQRAARVRGQRLFAELPPAFARRLGTYWDAWRN